LSHYNAFFVSCQRPSVIIRQEISNTLGRYFRRGSPSCLLRLRLTLSSIWITLSIEGSVLCLFLSWRVFAFVLFGSPHTASCCLQAGSACFARNCSAISHKVPSTLKAASIFRAFSVLVGTPAGNQRTHLVNKCAKCCALLKLRVRKLLNPNRLCLAINLL